MGSLCSKSANKSDNFSQPGRVLGGTTGNQNKQSAPVPSSIIASTPGRTLGTANSADSQNDPRSAAARAAEDRANKSKKPGGKLSEQLSAQKRQTQNQLLQASSDQERGARVADANTEARNWN